MSDSIEVPVRDRETGELVPDPGPTVPDLRTGEVIAVRAADIEELAAYMDTASQIHRDIGEAERVVNDELLRRLDADLTWTQTVGTGAAGYQFELKANSPSAGTTDYPPDELEQELTGLVKHGIISEAGAEKALRRRLKLTIEVPWKADLGAIVTQLKRATSIQIAGFDVTVKECEPERKSIAAGINALRKIAGAVQALDRAQRTKDAPARKVKVTRLGRSS